MGGSNKSSNSFFKSVAHHNLERFHSETIAWIFNTFPITAKNFIKSIHEGITSIEDIELDKKKCCWSELNQIDILLKYSYDSKNYQIIIENKMKASEHKIEAKKLKKGKSFDDYSPQLSKPEIEFLKKDDELKLSQTEYYYLREKMEREKQIFEFEKENDKQSFMANPYSILQKYISGNASMIQPKPFERGCIEFLIKNRKDDYCRYVYLKPSKIDEEAFKNHKKNNFNFEKLNGFNFLKLNTWNEQLSKNPWVTITYKQLINTIQESGAIENSEQILERYFKLKIKEHLENTIIANNYLEFIKKYIKEEVNLDDFNENKEYARYDYFKLLFALIKSELPSNEQIGEYIEAGSSNGGMPLFAFYKKIPLPSDAKFDFFKPKRKSINIGVQIQGENFKYYVSADENEYDDTKVISNNKNKYHEFVVEYILLKISHKYNDKFSEGNKYIIDDETYKGFHPNKTKTFYSRSYKIENFIASEKNKIDQPRDIFSVANEISEKVNHFVNFDVSTTIKNFLPKS